ncbi:UNVERIFIED_CONTAM: hypothetical protein HDU68_004953 [Siphonaria sp. JEL0065]|nr:hypothetical protein HDU68_004953 [Siphonaria sp. JEL0065]
MFSATLSSPAVRSLAAQQLVNKPIHEIDTTSVEHAPNSSSLTQNSSTARISDSIHSHIPQSYALMDYKSFSYSLYKLLLAHIEAHPKDAPAPPRIIVFFNASKHASYFAKAFAKLPGLRSASDTGRLSAGKGDKLTVYELHARLEQSRRAKVSDHYRSNTTSPSVLFTTDVSARGVDYPDVSLVVQMGCPSNSEQYVHRVGRTGRAGKRGEAVLICEPYERGFLKALEGIDGKIGVCGNEVIDSWNDSELPEDLKLRESVDEVFKRMGESEFDAAEGCYTSYLGYYNQQKYVSKAGVGLASERYARDVLLLPETPSLSKSLAQKMGLMNIKGVIVRGDSSGGGFRDGYIEKNNSSRSFSQPKEFESNRNKKSFGESSYKGKRKPERPWEGRGSKR